ncbi:FAD-dependent oxidoreductase [Acetobacterium tundrae]|uniref:NAD(P)-binding protein n=1 Tax=Acetobacterium tundrae TaxID=132932 RepID=A0ABR6WMT5_9FIRM|nr:FAD-dependent oxidoreductase [Acetobacterium tundrae]MBC3797470.1 NAD(P)-binding protein [Acetobacterium tundrae]
MDKKYQALFEPFMINNLEIKNKFFMTSMTIPVINEHGAYTNDAVEYYVTRAKGGIGLIITGANWVADNIEKHENHIFPSPTTDPDVYKNAAIEMTDRIHAFGCKIFVQLTADFSHSVVPHWIDETDSATLAAIKNQRDQSKSCRELKADEVEQIVAGFVEAAKIVQACGFDGIEVHEGKLFDDVTMMRINQRTDKYGGDLRGRLHFATEIVQAIKKSCGQDFPVILRFSIKSYIKALFHSALPEEDFKELGRDIGEALEAAKILEEAGYDGFDVDAGICDSGYWTHPPMYFEKGLYLPLTEQLKKVVRVPVLAAGRMDDPDIAAEALADGKLDAVGLGRPVLADPDYPNKLKNGDIKDIRPCLGCHDGCIERKLMGGRGSCSVNPECNRELIVNIESAKERKKIVVVGGGPAGLEAARVSAIRGYQVTLFETADRLGGNLKFGGIPVFKEDVRALITWYEIQLNELKVDVKLGTMATKAKIDALKPDIIYTAEGSKSIELKLPGIDGENVTNAIDVLTGKTYVGPKCIVIGGGLVGCEVALHLAKHRHKIIIVEASADILKSGVPMAPPNEGMLRDLLAFYKVDIVTNAQLTEVTPTGAVITADGQDRSITAHHIIVAVGSKSSSLLYSELKNDYSQIYILGDSQNVRNIRGAIWDAFEVARTI